MRQRGALIALVAGALLAFAGVGVSTAGAARAVTDVTVTFTDSSLKVSMTNPESGVVTFLVVNHGKRLHVLSISGPGVKNAHTAKLAAGRSARLTVTLQPGAYELSDPVGLGAYDVQFLDIIPAATVSATGNSSVVMTTPALPPMCGDYTSSP